VATVAWTGPAVMASIMFVPDIALTHRRRHPA
jgi:hypothetical protein